MIYTYQVSLYRYGGEHTIGTITRAQADYWIARGDDELSAQVNDFEEHADVPPEMELGYWHDVDDLLHLSSAEWATGNYIELEGISNPSFEVELGNMDSVSVKRDVMAMDDETGLYLDKTLNDENKVVCYGQSFEKGNWDFGKLEINHPLDVSKLRYELTRWDNLWLVDGLFYGDVELDNEGGDSIGKSMTFWIDD